MIDPDVEISNMFAQRNKMRAEAAAVKAAKQGYTNKRRTAWLRVLKSAIIEIGIVFALMVVVGKCCGAGLIDISVAAPTCIALFTALVWRACQYWHVLSA